MAGVATVRDFPFVLVAIVPEVSLCFFSIVLAFLPPSVAGVATVRDFPFVLVAIVPEVSLCFYV